MPITTPNVLFCGGAADLLALACTIGNNYDDNDKNAMIIIIITI